jgi:hypothetical protein
MTDWRDRLRDADRALEREFDPDAAERLRYSVVASARASTPGIRIWSRTFAATAAALTLICAGLLTALQDGNARNTGAGPSDSNGPALASAESEGPAQERQQLHFSTPGGTRIIWVFDSGFEVKGTLP